MAKRQHTTVVYRNKGAKGTGLEVAVIERRNPKDGRPYDVIRFYMKGLGGPGDNQILAYMTPDEAFEVSTALGFAANWWLHRFKPYTKFRRWFR